MKNQNSRKIFSNSQQKDQSQNSKQKLQIPCYYHPNQIITNFCLNEKCLMPLCPICIQQHSQEHYQINEVIELQHIDEVQSNCEFNLKKILEEQQKAQDSLEVVKKNLGGSSQVEEILGEKKKECYKIIDDYFDEIKTAYQKNCLQNQQQQTAEYQQQFFELSSLEKDLNKQLKQISNPNKMLSAAIKMLATNYFNSTSQYLSEFQNKLLTFQQKQTYLSINEEELINLNACLERYVQIINQQNGYPQQYPQPIQNFQNPNMIPLNKPYQPPVNQNRAIQQPQFIAPPRNQQNNIPPSSLYQPQNQNQNIMRVPAILPQTQQTQGQQQNMQMMQGPIPQSSYYEPNSQIPQNQYPSQGQPQPMLRQSYGPQAQTPQPYSGVRQTPYNQTFNY